MRLSVTSSLTPGERVRASSWTAGTDGVACAHGNGTPSNGKSASDYHRPQPHSQVMDNGIATSSLAIDLLWETRVYRGCLRWLRFASVEKRPPHRLNGQRLARVLPIRRSSGGSPQATNSAMGVLFARYRVALYRWLLRL